MFAVLSSGCGGDEEEGMLWSPTGAAIRLPGLRAACRKFDVRLSEAELQLIMDAASENQGRGAVSFEGFARIMRQTAWF